MSKSVIVLAIVVFSQLFITAGAAEQPTDPSPLIEELAGQAQNWIAIIQGNIDTINDKLPANISNSPGWKIIEKEWVLLKDRLNSVGEQAIRIFAIEPDSPVHLRDEQLNTVMSDMRHSMPKEQELELFLTRITDFANPEMIIVPPHNLEQEIQSTALKAQNRIDELQDLFDRIKKDLRSEILQTDKWVEIERQFNNIKAQLNAVGERAVELFMMESLPAADHDEHLRAILNEMKNLMTSEADLEKLKTNIAKIGKLAAAIAPAQPVPSLADVPVTKPAIQQSQMSTTEIPVATFDVPELIPQHKNMRLQPLDDKLIEAGVNRPGEYYNLAEIRRLEIPYGGFRALHTIGNYINEDFLAKYFFSSLFQYYTTELLGYNLEWSEDFFVMLLNDAIAYLKGTENPKYPGHLLQLAKKLTNMQNFNFQNKRHQDLFNAYDPYLVHHYILRATGKFKQNKLLRELGIAYQRQKIVLEKLEHLAQVSDSNLLKLVLKQDLFLTDLQTLIYYFMDEAYSKLMSDLRKIKTFDEQQLNEFANFLVDYKPQFLKSLPYYQKIIDNLAKFRQPSQGYFNWGGKIYKID